MIPGDLIESLADELEVMGEYGVVPGEVSIEIAKALRGHSSRSVVRLEEPLRITASFSWTTGDLTYSRCSRCGRVSRLSSSAGSNSSCECGGVLVPAPVWCIASRRAARDVVTLDDTPLFLLSISDYSSLVTRRDESIVRVASSSLSRPLATLRLYTVKSSLDVRYVVERDGIQYMLHPMPSESMTKPLTITVFSYNRGDCESLPITPIAGIAEVMFCEKLEVLEATILYKAGHPRIPAQERIAFLNKKSGDPARISIPSRHIVTEGVVVKIHREDVRETASRFTTKPLWVALHTISHAFLYSLPRLTGLEGGDFGEAISLSKTEIAIYDNAPGGLGGLRGVTRDDTALKNYEQSIREAHKCPLACLKACKACLYTESCTTLNQGLDRRILERLHNTQPPTQNSRHY